MLTPRASMTIAAAALAGAVALGMGLGWKLNAPSPAKPETPAPEIKQADGSRALERQPNPSAKPKQQLPKGAKPERIVSVAVRPRTSGPSPADKANPRPVTVDLTLVRMPDQTRRVIASSPDGEVIGGLDVPVEAAPIPKQPKWAVCALTGYEIHERRQVYGVSVSRFSGPFAVTGGVIGRTVFVGAGVRW